MKSGVRGSGNNSGGGSGSGGGNGNFANNQQGRSSRLAFFDHLPRKLPVKNPDLVEADRILHPATIKLGGLYSKGLVQADDDRVTVLISAFCTIIRDYKTPPKKILREDLDRFLSKQVQFLVECRQLSRGMGNLIKFLRYSVSKISPEISEAEAKEILLGKLQSFLEEKVLYAAENITRYVASAIREHDVILTFGSSPLIRKVLLSLSKVKQFRLVIIDARPLNEGLATLSALSTHVNCVYSPLSGAAAAMKDQQVTRVLLGASSLQSNGSMLGPAGTAMVASLAKARQIPVIVAAESYKFNEKVQLDSIVYNEMGSASEIAVMQLSATGAGGSSSSSSSSGGGGGSGSNSKSYAPAPQRQPGYRGPADGSAGDSALTAGGGGVEVHSAVGVGAAASAGASSQTDPITVPVHWYMGAGSSHSGADTKASIIPLPFDVVNLRYDLTPINNISAVVTETGLIPPTSIPVLMREIQSDILQLASSSSSVLAASNVGASTPATTIQLAGNTSGNSGSNGSGGTSSTNGLAIPVGGL
mmetsp:Transcript_4327/g.7095  ORF Transcript_4327/g.7095 Transcript_4327/m.7095 type:complete len:532 (+) Transcript_4327:77-1672(+)